MMFGGAGAGMGRSRRLAGLGIGIRRTTGVRRLGTTRRWYGARSWSDWRFPRWTFGRRRSGLASRKLHSFLHPGLIILRTVHDQHPFHAVMTQATKLAADDFKAALLDWLKPHWNNL